jgi:RNA polymerase sigma-70 factor (ECF subfamily)
LIGRYRGRLLALTRRMLGRASADAEDVVQDALVAAYQRRNTYRAGEPFRPWLYRIAINRCVDRLRAGVRAPAQEPLGRSEEVADRGAGPLQRLISAEQEERLRDAVETLPPKLRAVFLLRHLDELSYDEIARATELPMGTVKTHLFRARAALRAKLSGFLEPAPLSDVDERLGASNGQAEQDGQTP